MRTNGESGDGQNPESSGTRKPFAWFVHLELLLGIGISVGLFWLARSIEQAQSRRVFSAVAEHRREALQRSLDGTVEVLYSLKALLEAEETVAREQFHRFAEGLLARHPEILAVEWLPRVRAGERASFTAAVRRSGFPEFEIREASAPGEFRTATNREEYFPILFVEPMAEHRVVLGLDPSTEPLRAAAMRRAAQTHAASATAALVPLKQTGETEPRVAMVFAPVYRDGPAKAQTDPPDGNLTGYARAVVQVARLGEVALQSAAIEGLEAVIADAVADAQGQAIPQLHAQHRPADSTSRERRAEAGWRWEGDVRFADHTLKLVCFPSPAGGESEWGWLSRSVLAGGLITTLLGASYLHAVLRRRLEREKAELEIKQAEVAQARTAARFRALFENMIEGYAYCRLIYVDGKPVDLVYLAINPAFEKLTGLRDVVGKKLGEILPSFRKSHSDAFELYGRVVSPGKPQRYERYVDELGKWFSVAEYSPEEDCLVMVFDDITERKLAEQELRRERERLRRMVDTSQVGIAFGALDGSVHEINEALLRMIGWTREEFEARGLNWRALMPLEYSEHHREHMEQLSRRGAVGPIEEVLLHKDGRRIPVVCNRARLPDGGKPEHVAFVMDLTDRRRLESALHDATEAERARIARDLHDGLGQQLGGMLYLSRMLQSDLEVRAAPETKRAVEIHQLIKESLELTRDVARGLHPVPPGPEGLMTALESLVERLISGRGTEFIFECEPSVLVEDARTATYLYRIAQEAVNNALKHSHATRIEIALWQDGETIHLAVRDNGIGMARGPVGHGLGMHTMKHRALLLGGLLRVQDGTGGVLVNCDVPRIRPAQMPSSTPLTEKQKG